MKLLDIVFLVLIIGYCAYIVFTGKKAGCSGQCDRCGGCCSKKKEEKGANYEAKD